MIEIEFELRGFSVDEELNFFFQFQFCFYDIVLCIFYFSWRIQIDGNQSKEKQILDDLEATRERQGFIA